MGVKVDHLDMHIMHFLGPFTIIITFIRSHEPCVVHVGCKCGTLSEFNVINASLKFHHGRSCKAKHHLIIGVQNGNTFLRF